MTDPSIGGYCTSALFLLLTNAPHHTHSYEKLSVEVDELTAI